MNRISKFGFPLIVALVSLVMASCTDEYDYEPNTVSDNEGAYILADETSLVFTEEEEQSLTFTVHRHNTAEAKAYKLYCSELSINVPAEVSFEAGEESKSITVDFNLPSGTIDQEIVVGVSDEDAYIYGAHSQTFTVSCLRRIDGCEFYTQMAGAVSYSVNVYEYGVETEKDEEGNEVITARRYILKDPYAPLSDIADDGVGYNITFSVKNNGKATSTANQTIFYCSAELSQSASIVGPVYISGSGSYYKDEATIEPGLTANNFVLFSWSLVIGNTGYGFGTKAHAIIFPDDYNPLTQSEF